MNLFSVRNLVASTESDSISLSYKEGTNKEVKKALDKVTVQGQKSLSLANNRLSGDFLSYLEKFLKKNKSIKVVNLSENKFKDSNAEKLKKIISKCLLTQLDVSRNKFSDKGVQLLFEGRTAKIIFAGNPTKIFPVFTKSMVDLSKRSLNDKQLQCVLTRISPNVTADQYFLNLNTNDLTEKALDVITQFISQHPTIKHIELSHNNFGVTCDNQLNEFVQKNKIELVYFNQDNIPAYNQVNRVAITKNSFHEDNSDSQKVRERAPTGTPKLIKHKSSIYLQVTGSSKTKTSYFEFADDESSMKSTQND